MLALDRTSEAAHLTRQQMSRYETPTITDEGSAACVKDLHTATYTMVGVSNMLKGMDAGLEQAFGEALRAVKDLDGGVVHLVNAFVRMQEKHQRELRAAVGRAALEVSIDNDATVGSIRAELNAEITALSKILYEERIELAKADAEIKAVKDKLSGQNSVGKELHQRAETEMLE